MTAATPSAPSTEAWAGIEAALGALGRVALLLSDDFRIVHATSTLDSMVCEGSHRMAVGRHASDLFGGGVFDEGSAVVQTLRHGERQEGRRAFLRCQEDGSRLVSLSVAPLSAREQAVLGAGAGYVVFVRPAEQDAASLDNAAGALGIVTQSAAMLGVVRLIEALHRSDSTVLITGESGTGKEVVARALHTSSRRRQGPFVAVNCAALPGELLESELFGHVRGAFTGATRDRTGRIELAAGGTLFLDEVGDMSPDLQAKLLRVLQEHQYERLGESTPRTMDVRVIAATNRDLGAAVASGAFRQDLYYRLRVVPIHLPPLRERPEDIEPLTRYLLSRIGARTGRAIMVSPNVLSRLRSHSWPGNVRELENTLEYAVAVCKGQTLSVEELPESLHQDLVATASARSRAAPRPREAAPAGSDRVAVPRSPLDLRPPPAEPVDGCDEAGRIRAALEAHRWHRGEAARALGLSRTTLWRRMQALGIK